MHVLGICGSLRSGNTEAILKRIIEGVTENGGNAELILLREKHIQICGGCLKCEETKHCHVMDDMQRIYPKLFAADVLLLGSPNYFNNISGAMKNFIDRLAPHWEQRLKGKKAVLVVVGDEGGASLRHAAGALKRFCGICGVRVVKTIRVKAHHPKDALKNEKIMRKSYRLGKAIAKQIV